MKKANPFFQQAMKIIKPFAIGLVAGSGFLACVSSSAPPAVAFAARAARPAFAQAVLISTPAPGGATVFERVEDYYGRFPDTVSQSTGPINLVPPSDPLLAAARIRGVQWPMVNNAGASAAYPQLKGQVSFYHEDTHVATGEHYDPRDMTAAHKTLPFGTIVRCTRMDTGRSVIVMINDRGPYVRGRILDLSRSAAHELDMLQDGVATCLVEVLAYPLIETMGPKGNG